MATASNNQDGGTRISKRVERELHQSKVVIRRLPPDFTEEKFLAAFPELPPHNFFYCSVGDPGLGDHSFFRAYISFTDESSIVPFRDKYDGLYLESEKGLKYRAVIEFAPYQGIPKKLRKKPDSRIATIEQDPDYQAFLQSLEVKKTPPTIAELAAYVDSIGTSKISQVQRTPLIEYLESHRRSSRSGKRSKPSDLKKKRGKESSSRSTKESYSKDSEGSKGSKDYRSKSREKLEKKRDTKGASSSYSSSVAEERRKDKGGSYQGKRGGRNSYHEENGEVRAEADRKTKEIRIKNRDRPDQVMYAPRNSKELGRSKDRERDGGSNRQYASNDAPSEYSQRDGDEKPRHNRDDYGTDERPRRNRDDYGTDDRPRRNRDDYGTDDRPHRYRDDYGKERRYEGGKRGDGYRGRGKDSSSSSSHDRSKPQSSGGYK